MENASIRMFGYLYDFWVYVVGQSTNEITSQGTKFQYGNLIADAWDYAGPNSFAFPICDSPGVYYNVVSSYDEAGGTIFVQEQPERQNHYFRVPWKTEEEIEDIKRITIAPEYRDEISHLLHILVNQSPVKKLYVQIRRQGLERDNIAGMLTVEQFGDMVKNNELLGNMVYVIRES